MTAVHPVQPSAAREAGGKTAVLADLIDTVGGLELLTLSDPRGHPSIPVLSRPHHRTLDSVKPLLDEYLDHPERRVGTATLLSAAAFYQHVERFKGVESVIFADPAITTPSLTAIYDYHQQGGPTAVLTKTAKAGWCRHRARCALRMSDEWQTWVGVHQKPMIQPDFAAFLADHISDLVLVDDAKEPRISEIRELLQARIGSPSQIMNLSRGIEVNQQVVVKNAVSLDDGSIKISYAETQAGTSGQPMTTPTLFFVTIPVFYAGPAYRIPIRIRYKVAGPALLWSLHLYRHDRVFDDAFNALLVEARAETMLPVLLGSPEV